MGQDRFEPIEVSVDVVLAETDKAIGFKDPGDDELTWIPKSQICDESEVNEKGDSGTLVIPYWLAFDKGLI